MNEFVPIGAITVICYIICLIVKAMSNEEFSKWLPTLCAVVGGSLGIVAMYIMPEFPAQDALSAIAVGVVSGLAATGAHQVGHQLTK